VHPQLQSVIDEFGAAQARLHSLAATVPSADWPRRAQPERWSIAECVAHLNLSSAAFVPLLRRAMAGGSPDASAAARRFRRDPVGWLLWAMAGPPVRMRVKTAASFIPQATTSSAALVTEFDMLQVEQLACVREGDGLPLDRLWIASPFDARVRYNVYACLTILPLHQHRHLWQAEQVWLALQHPARP
jgi:DinB family protein